VRKLSAAYANRYSRTLRQRPKTVLGMRRVAHINPLVGRLDSVLNNVIISII
jgi:hypothetical protein